MLITVDKRGSINLPKTLREEFGIESGTCLNLEIEEGEACKALGRQGDALDFPHGRRAHLLQGKKRVAWKGEGCEKGKEAEMEEEVGLPGCRWKTAETSEGRETLC